MNPCECTPPPKVQPLTERQRRNLFATDGIDPDMYCDEVIDWDDLERQPVRGNAEINARKIPADPITQDIIRTFFSSPAKPITPDDCTWLGAVLQAMADSDMRRRGLK